jgi:hypothetical protein
MVGDGAVTTIAATVVGDGPVGPSLPHAASVTDAAANSKTLFMSTLLARKSVSARGGHCDSIHT